MSEAADAPIEATPEKESYETKRMNISIGPRIQRELTELSTASGSSKAEVIRDAIAFRSWMVDVQNKGGRILVERKAGSGDIAEIVKP